jgi:hypothetical protein
MEFVTIYYVSCKSCGQEIEIDRKPREENIATAFSAAWAEDRRCGRCEAAARYVRADVKERQAPPPKPISPL